MCSPRPAAPCFPPQRMASAPVALYGSLHLMKVPEFSPGQEGVVEAQTAVFPTIVAASFRRRQGTEPLEPREDLGHAANLLWMMEGREASPERVHWLDTYLVLLADHGLNASTFIARVIASTGSDLASCVVGAIAALKGPAHGGATYAA